MAVTRINEFQAKGGRGAELRELIGSFLPAIEASPGCVSCQLLRSLDDSARLVVLEVWESAETHQAAAGNIPAESLKAAMALLAAPPKGDYYVE